MSRIIESIPIDFDGKRSLRFGRPAVFQCEIELTKLWGRPYSFYEAIYNLANIFSDSAINLSLNNLSMLLWQGLRHEAPSLTLDEVQEALPFDDPPALIPLVGKVLEAWQAMSAPVDPTMPTNETDTDPFGVSTGAPSGPTNVSISD